MCGCSPHGGVKGVAVDCGGGYASITGHVGGLATDGGKYVVDGGGYVGDGGVHVEADVGAMVSQM